MNDTTARKLARLEKLEALLRKPDMTVSEATGYGDVHESRLWFDEGFWCTGGARYSNLDDALEALVP